MFSGVFYEVYQFAHLHIRLDLNASLSHVQDTCQFIHTAASAAAENEHQMSMAAKLLVQDRLCAEFLGRARDQLLTLGYDDVYDKGYVAFNVLRSGRFASAVREKGKKEKLSRPTPESLPTAEPYQSSLHTPLFGQLPPTRECSRSDLLGPDTTASLERTCTSWFIPEVLPDHPQFSPQSPVARDYSLWMASRDPEVLRQAYMEMQKWQGVRAERSVPNPFRFAEVQPFRYAPPQPLSEMRPKRQAVVGALALGGVVLLSQWDNIMEYLGFGSSTTDATVRAVNEDTRHLKIMQDHVMQLETITQSMRTALSYTERYEHLEDEYDTAVSLRSEVFGQYSYIYAGIEQLKSSHRLNSAIVHPPFVNEALTQLSADLRQDFKDLLIEDKNDVYQLETSYVMLPNFTLDIFVHVPVGDHSRQLKLYEFIPAPIRLSNHSQFFQVEPFRTHIAVGPSRKDDYKELSPRDLSACKVLQHFYYCPHQSVLGFDHAASCLSALFWNEDEMVRLSCPLKPVPHKDYFVQLNPSEFVLALDQRQPFRFKCDGDYEGVITLEGILKITIPPGCMLEGNLFTLHPTNELHYQVGDVLTRPMNSAKETLAEMVDYATNASHLYNVQSGNIGPSLAEVSKDWTEHIVKLNTDWTFKQYILAGFGVVAAIVILLGAFKCYFYQRQSRNYRTATENITGLSAELGLAEERLSHRFTLAALLRKEEQPMASEVDTSSPAPLALDDISERMEEEEEGEEESQFASTSFSSPVRGYRSVTQSLPGHLQSFAP